MTAILLPTGMLMKLAVSKAIGNNLHYGICSDPMSFEFCRKIGLDYVSCSPFRLPITPLVAIKG